MKKIYGIQKWALEERPREKLLSKSPHQLSTAELLAIILNSGSGPKTSIDLANEILKLTDYNLPELAKIPIKKLLEIKGIGSAKATKIIACLELGRRQQARLPEKLHLVNRSQDAAYYLQARLGHYPNELFGVIYMNYANKIKDFAIISEGGLTSTTVDIRIILRKALEKEATKLILVHNHPSGSLEPSQSDKILTSRIQVAANSIDMKVLDHLIVTFDGYFSFADAGLL